MHVGGRPESQVCLAGGRTVDGWRSDGGGPAGLLSGETDSKQANRHTHTHRENKTGILLTSISLRASSLITAPEHGEKVTVVAAARRTQTCQAQVIPDSKIKGGAKWQGGRQASRAGGAVPES